MATSPPPIPEGASIIVETFEDTVKVVRYVLKVDLVSCAVRLIRLLLAVDLFPQGKHAWRDCSVHGIEGKSSVLAWPCAMLRSSAPFDTWLNQASFALQQEASLLVTMPSKPYEGTGWCGCPCSTSTPSDQAVLQHSSCCDRRSTCSGFGLSTVSTQHNT